MKIIVFGGSGFLGSHVADQLSLAKHSVTVYDREHSPFLRSDQKMVVGDILDYHSVLKAVNGADVIYNFAGESDISIATNAPLKTIETNVVGNANILEACRQSKIKRYIFASTIYVYSHAGSFYRATKQSCELFIESYHKQYGLDFTVLRYGSLYGPRADEKNFIHSIVKQALEKKKIVRKGDGEEIREYVHVMDAARLSAKMIEAEFANQHIIITGQQMMKIKDVLGMLKEILGNKIEIEFLPSEEEGHYEITPYHFQPRFARKLTDNSYVDFGQGLIELLNLEHEKHQKKNSMQRV